MSPTVRDMILNTLGNKRSAAIPPIKSQRRDI
jgi:hypothetical protein